MKYILAIAITYIFAFNIKNTSHADYPRPEDTSERLFFIQRNMNKNTIVYDASFDKNGNLNEEAPVNVYWIRFEEEGQKMDLRNLERNFAYGIEFNKLNTQSIQYSVKIVADKSRELILKQIAPFKAEVYIKIDNKLSELDHMYINADNSGFWPDLEYIELFGIDTKTKNSTYEKVHY